MQKLTIRQLFFTFLKLGLTSFGGPVAHLGYFRDEFVTRRKLMPDSTYADLVALCQFLPGPASSQVGIGIGLSQAGLRGGLAAWCGFTLPSALALVLFAYGVMALDPSIVRSGWLHGLKVAAVAVVAQAIWGMAASLCPDAPRKILALLAAVISLVLSGVAGQMTAILAGALLGLLLLAPPDNALSDEIHYQLKKSGAVLSLLLFFILLLILPILSQNADGVAVFESFFRTGALVFGGGHVVLPLLQAELVNPGWVDTDLFMAGYGAAQAVPGPLFTFSAFLGSVLQVGPGGWAGGLLCLAAIFFPSFLLLTGILPFWENIRRNRTLRSALLGINAAVVGLLIAAFYDPVWKSGILSIGDFVLAAGAFAMLIKLKLPPWLVVAICGVGGAVISGVA